MDEFQHLPIQFGQVLKAKNFNRCGVLPVGVGDPTFPRILFRHERGNLRSRRVALINMAEAGRAGGKSSEKKISGQITRNGPVFCC